MQTAIEWLKKELEEYGSSSHLSLDWSTFDELCEQAKEMEKQQIIDAWSNGYDEDDRASPSPLKYFSETYGSKGSDETKTDKI